MVEFIKGGDFKDVITCVDTDNNNAPVNIANLPGFEVWYYTNRNSPFKFIREIPATGSNKIQLIKTSNFEYVAFLTDLQTKELQNGRLYIETMIALTDSDAADGSFKSLGSKATDLVIVDKPISNV